jgi:hypothetical protein
MTRVLIVALLVGVALVLAVVLMVLMGVAVMSRYRGSSHRSTHE